MRKVLRILLVANEDRNLLQSRWYSTEWKLRNGLIRNDHLVLFFSDRDVARELSLLPSKKFGVKKMNLKLVETVRHFAPHIVLFGHADLCSNDTFEAIRLAAPGVRLAQFNVDATFRVKTMKKFAGRARHMDASFITTCDAAGLKPLLLRNQSLYFMPNPVDASIETSRVHDQPASSLDWDGQFLGTGIEKRAEQLDYIATNLPTGYRFSVRGRATEGKHLVSASYFNALAQGASSPNLPLDDARPAAYLYSSDRIAQLLGSGVLAYTQADAGLSALYEDGIVEWKDRASLVESMARFGRDDTARRTIAGIGHRLAHERMSSTLVSAAMIETIMEWPLSHSYAWPTDPIP